VRKNPPFQASAESFGKLYSITNQGLGVKRSNKFMRNDYFQNVILPKNPDWQRTLNRDWDNDGRNDIVIHDPQGNIKYFNGYSLYKVPKNHYSYIDYASKNVNGSLKAYRMDSNPTKVRIGEAVGFISKVINEKLKAVGRADLIKHKNDAKFNDRLKSIIKRFLLLPYAYKRLGYDTREIEDGNVKSLKLYAKKGIKELLKNEGANVIETIMNSLSNNIVAEIQKDVKTFVEGVVNGNSTLIQPFYDSSKEYANWVNQQSQVDMGNNDNQEVEEELDV
jgi:hypothetical protein